MPFIGKLLGKTDADALADLTLRVDRDMAVPRPGEADHLMPGFVRITPDEFQQEFGPNMIRGVIDDPTGARLPDNAPRVLDIDLDDFNVELRRVILDRGGADLRADGSLRIDTRFRLVKIVWQHGEKSAKRPVKRVRQDDILDLTDVIREREPRITEAPDGSTRWEWTRERADGERVHYAVKRFTETDEGEHIVTIFVVDDANRNRPAFALSPKRETGDPGSPTGGSKPTSRDTPEELSSRSDQGQDAPVDSNISTDEAVEQGARGADEAASREPPVEDGEGGSAGAAAAS